MISVNPRQGNPVILEQDFPPFGKIFKSAAKQKQG
jgi:hypothetical protein